jgi:hypothetical protein
LLRMRIDCGASSAPLFGWSIFYLLKDMVLAS